MTCCQMQLDSCCCFPPAGLSLLSLLACRYCTVYKHSSNNFGLEGIINYCRHALHQAWHADQTNLIDWYYCL